MKPTPKSTTNQTTQLRKFSQGKFQTQDPGAQSMKQHSAASEKTHTQVTLSSNKQSSLPRESRQPSSLHEHRSGEGPHERSEIQGSQSKNGRALSMGLRSPVPAQAPVQVPGRASNHISQITQQKENQIQQMKLINQRLSQQQMNMQMLVIQGKQNQIQPKIPQLNQNQGQVPGYNQLSVALPGAPGGPAGLGQKKSELLIVNLSQDAVQLPLMDGLKNNSGPETAKIIPEVMSLLSRRRETQRGEKVDETQLQTEEDVKKELFSSNGSRLLRKSHDQHVTSRSLIDFDGLSPVTLPDPGHLAFLYSTSHDSPGRKENNAAGFKIKIHENHISPALSPTNTVGDSSKNSNAKEKINRIDIGKIKKLLESSDQNQKINIGGYSGTVSEIKTLLSQYDPKSNISRAGPAEAQAECARQRMVQKYRSIPKPQSGITDPAIVNRMKVESHLSKITQVQKEQGHLGQGAAHGRNQSSKTLKSSQEKEKPSSSMSFGKKELQRLHEQAVWNNLIQSLAHNQNDNQEHETLEKTEKTQEQGIQSSGTGNIIAYDDKAADKFGERIRVQKRMRELQQQRSSIVTKASIEELARTQYREATPGGRSRHKAPLDKADRSGANATHNSLAKIIYANFNESNNADVIRLESYQHDQQDLVETKDQASSISPFKAGNKTLNHSSFYNNQGQQIGKSRMSDSPRSERKRSAQKDELNLVSGRKSPAVNEEGRPGAEAQPDAKLAAAVAETEPTDAIDNHTATLDEGNAAGAKAAATAAQMLNKQNALANQQFELAGQQAIILSPSDHNRHFQQKPQTAENNQRRRTQQNRKRHLEQDQQLMIKSQKYWDVRKQDAAKSALSGPSGAAGGVFSGSSTQNFNCCLSIGINGNHNGPFGAAQNAAESGPKTPIGFDKRMFNSSQFKRRKDAKNQKLANKVRNHSSVMDRMNQNLEGQQNRSQMSANTGTSPSAAAQLNDGMQNTSTFGAKVSANESNMRTRPTAKGGGTVEEADQDADQPEGGFGKAFKSSFGFVEKLEVKDIQAKIYSREGSLSNDGVVFFVKQLYDDRMIRTNKSHNLRQRLKEAPANDRRDNCKPLGTNYIHNRILLNQKHYEKCKGRRQEYQAREWLERHREKMEVVSGTYEGQPQPTQQNEIILITDPAVINDTPPTYVYELDYQGGTRVTESRRPSGAPVSAVEIPSPHLSAIGEKTAIEIDLTQNITAGLNGDNPHVSPGIFNRMYSNISNHENSLDGSKSLSHERAQEREGTALSPIAFVDKALSNEGQPKGVEQSKYWVHSVQDKGTGVSGEQEEEQQSAQVKVLNTRGSGKFKAPAPASRGRGAERNGANKNQIKQPATVKHSDQDFNNCLEVYQLQELDSSLYNTSTRGAANKRRQGENELITRAPQPLMYEPIQSKIQRMSSHALQQQTNHDSKFKTATEIQMIINAHRAKMASQQIQHNQQRRRSGATSMMNQAMMRPQTQHLHKKAYSTQNASWSASNNQLANQVREAGDLTKFKMQKITQQNLSQAQANSSSKPLWNVGTKPRSRIVNYRTQDGQRMSKLSAGDPYTKLHRLMRDKQESQQTGQTEYHLRQPKTKHGNRLTVNPSARRNSRMSKTADDLESRAVYGMKELKVGVDPRYLLKSRENQNRTAMLKSTSPNNRDTKFEDLNLHKLTTDNQNQGALQGIDRPGEMHSSMGKATPSIVTNQDEAGPGSSLMAMHNNPLIPTAARSAQHNARKSSTVEIHPTQSSEPYNRANRESNQIQSIIKDIMSNEHSARALVAGIQSTGRAREVNAGPAEENQKSSPEPYVASDSKGELSVKKGQRAPLDNAYIASSLKVSERAGLEGEDEAASPLVECARDGTLIPSSQHTQHERRASGVNGQKQASNNVKNQSGGGDRRSSGRERPQVRRSINLNPDQSQSARQIGMDAPQKAKEKPTTLSSDDQNIGLDMLNIRTVSSPQPAVGAPNQHQLITIGQIADRNLDMGASDATRELGQGTGDIAFLPNLTLTPHSNQQMSSSPKSKASSKIVFQQKKLSPVIAIRQGAEKGRDGEQLQISAQAVSPFQPVILQTKPRLEDDPAQRGNGKVHGQLPRSPLEQQKQRQAATRVNVTNAAVAKSQLVSYPSSSKADGLNEAQDAGQADRWSTSRINNEEYSQVNKSQEQPKEIRNQEAANLANLADARKDTSGDFACNDLDPQSQRSGRREELEEPTMSALKAHVTRLGTTKNATTNVASGSNPQASNSQVLQAHQNFGSFGNILQHKQPATDKFQEMINVGRNSFLIQSIEKVQPPARDYRQTTGKKQTTAKNAEAAVTQTYPGAELGLNTDVYPTPHQEAHPSAAVQSSVSTVNPHISHYHRSDGPGPFDAIQACQIQITGSDITNASPLEYSRAGKLSKLQTFDKNTSQGNQSSKLLKPQLIPLKGEITADRTGEDTKTNNTIHMSPKSIQNSDHRGRADGDQQRGIDDCQQTSFVDPISQRASKPSPLLQERPRGRKQPFDRANAPLSKIAEKMVQHAIRQPIHSNPPDYLKKENFGMKYKYMVPPGRNRRNNTVLFHSEQQQKQKQPITHHGWSRQAQRQKFASSETQCERTQHESYIGNQQESSWRSQWAPAGGLKPLGIVKEISAPMAQAMDSSLISQTTTLDAQAESVPNDGKQIYHKTREFYDSQVRDVKCDKARSFVNIQIDPQVRVDPQNSIMRVADGLAGQQSPKQEAGAETRFNKAATRIDGRLPTRGNNAKTGEATKVLVANELSDRGQPGTAHAHSTYRSGREGARSSQGGLPFEEFQQFAITPSPIENFMLRTASQPSNSGNSRRIVAYTTESAASKVEEIQNRAATGLSHSEKWQLQILQEYIVKNQNQMQWKQGGTPQEETPTKPKSSSQNPQRGNKSDFKKGVSKVLNGLGSKQATAEEAPADQHQSVKQMWEQRLQNKQLQAQAAAAAAEIQHLQKDKPNHDIVVIVSSPKGALPGGAANQANCTTKSFFNSQGLEVNAPHATVPAARQAKTAEVKARSGAAKVAAGQAGVAAGANQALRGAGSRLEQRSESAGGKISLDSAAVRELMGTQDLLDSYANPKIICRRAEASKIQQISNLRSDQKDDKKQMGQLGGRDLFHLPTSEIEDLYKEQKEMKQANERGFGLVGRQPTIHNQAQAGDPSAQQRQQKQAYRDKQKVKAKCPRLIKIENQQPSAQNHKAAKDSGDERTDRLPDGLAIAQGPSAPRGVALNENGNAVHLMQTGSICLEEPLESRESVENTKVLSNADSGKMLGNAKRSNMDIAHSLE